MNLNFPNDLLISEDKFSRSFLQRYQLQTDGVNFKTDIPTKFGKICPTKKLEFSELKTSLLVKTMIHDIDVHSNLLVFLRNIVINIFSFLMKTYNLNVNINLNSRTLQFLDSAIIDSRQAIMTDKVKQLISNIPFLFMFSLFCR